VVVPTGYAHVQADGLIKVSRAEDSRTAKAQHGLCRYLSCAAKRVGR
jgi:hypothetical protein